MASIDLNSVEGLNRDLGERDNGLTFEEAYVQVNGQKLAAPLSKPLKSDRPTGDVILMDLPLREVFAEGGRL